MTPGTRSSTFGGFLAIVLGACAGFFALGWLLNYFKVGQPESGTWGQVSITYAPAPGDVIAFYQSVNGQAGQLDHSEAVEACSGPGGDHRRIMRKDVMTYVQCIRGVSR